MQKFLQNFKDPNLRQNKDLVTGKSRNRVKTTFITIKINCHKTLTFKKNYRFLDYFKNN